MRYKKDEIIETTAYLLLLLGFLTFIICYSSFGHK